MSAELFPSLRSYLVTCLASGAIAACLPAFVQATEIQFNFTGGVVTIPGVPQGVWNGPGPIPQTFQLSFLVNTLSPGNSFQYSFPNSSPNACVDSVNISLVATDFNASVNGQSVVEGASGSYAFSGGNLGPCSYIGGSYGASGGTGSHALGFSGVPDFGLGNPQQSAVRGSSDPLATLLNGSGYFSDSGDITYLIYDGSVLTAVVSGSASSVPEPDSWMLFAAGALGLVLFRRQGTSLRTARPADCDRPMSSSTSA
jgi:hypothetical protein